MRQGTLWFTCGSLLRWSLATWTSPRNRRPTEHLRHWFSRQRPLGFQKFSYHALHKRANLHDWSHSYFSLDEWRTPLGNDVFLMFKHLLESSKVISVKLCHSANSVLLSLPKKAASWKHGMTTIGASAKWSKKRAAAARSASWMVKNVKSPRYVSLQSHCTCFMSVKNVREWWRESIQTEKFL